MDWSYNICGCMWIVLLLLFHAQHPVQISVLLGLHFFLWNYASFFLSEHTFIHISWRHNWCKTILATRLQSLELADPSLWNCERWNIIDNLEEVLSSHQSASSPSPPEHFIKYAVNLCTWILVWKLLPLDASLHLSCVLLMLPCLPSCLTKLCHHPQQPKTSWWCRRLMSYCMTQRLSLSHWVQRRGKHG